MRTEKNYMWKLVTCCLICFSLCSCAGRSARHAPTWDEPDAQTSRNVLRTYLDKSGGLHDPKIESSDWLDSMIVSEFRGTCILDPLALAIWRLHQTGSQDDLAFIKPFLKSYSPVHRHVATITFGKLADREDLALLVPQLGDGDAGVRHAALQAISLRKYKEALAGVEACLNDPDKEVKEQAERIVLFWKQQ